MSIYWFSFQHCPMSFIFSSFSIKFFQKSNFSASKRAQLFILVYIDHMCLNFINIHFQQKGCSRALRHFRHSFISATKCLYLLREYSSWLYCVSSEKVWLNHPMQRLDFIIAIANQITKYLSVSTFMSDQIFMFPCVTNIQDMT